MATATQTAVISSGSPDDLLGFGKHSNKKWSEVSAEYLQWLVDQNSKKYGARAVEELDRRALAAAGDPEAEPSEEFMRDVPAWEEANI